MFKRNDYAYRLMEKENKRLLRENERLRNQIDKIEKLKIEYQKLIEELKTCRDRYNSSLEKINSYEIEIKKEISKLIK